MQTIFALLLAFAWAGAAAQEALPPPVAHALERAEISPQAVAIVAQSLEGGPPLLRHRGDAAHNPASLMKLLTTLAALEILGPAHVWRTEAIAATSVVDGVLEGDLFLRGSGDPKFTHERLWLLLRDLRNRGLREIRGDLVLDRRAFTPIAHDPAAFDGRPQRPYNVGPDALLFNFATVHLTLLPEGGGVRVLADPLPANMRIDNHLRLIEGQACMAHWRERLTALVLADRIELSGDYPAACEEKRWHLAGVPNEALLAGTFERLWRELGGSFSGQVREGSTPADAVTLAFTESPPLADIVRDVNKFSNNVMAWQLFLRLGHHTTARQEASLSVGEDSMKVDDGGTGVADRRIRDWLSRQGLDFPELVIDNGSGLSRTTRISADNLARLLAAGWASPAMPEFVSSLPIAATDGTTKRRFHGNGFAGRAHLKTGSLDGVRGIAGYLLDREGQRHLVVFMVNHPNAARAQPAFDALLEWMWQGGA